MAAGPLPRVRGRGHAVGARRDRQSAGWRPRTGHAGGHRDEGPPCRRGRTRGDGRRARVETHLLALLGLGGEEQARRRPPQRGVLCLAAVPRGARRAAAARPGRRGHPLGRRGPARLRRRARRLDDVAYRCSSLRPLGPSFSSAGPAGAAGSSNATTLALSAALGRADGRTDRRLLAPAAARRPRPSRRCSSARAAIRCTPSSSSSSTRSGLGGGAAASRRRCRASSPPVSTGSPTSRRPPAGRRRRREGVLGELART